MSGVMINFKGKIVGVLGLGVSGMAALTLLAKKESKILVFNKGKVSSWPQLNTVLNFAKNENLFDDQDPLSLNKVEECELLILSPGISREHPLVKKCLQLNIPVWSEIELGFQFAQAPIIAITGTNGKTTTTTMMGQILENDGKKVFVGGNIGRAFCEIGHTNEKWDYIVLELSSFQLESIISFHPQIALILNLKDHHGERYKSIKDYGMAKFEITKNMNSKDHLLLPMSSPLLMELGRKNNIHLHPVNDLEILKLKLEIEEEYSLKDIKVPGDHNIINFYFCIKALKILNISREAIQKTINSFMGVEHRMEKVPTSHADLSFYNDAKSTNWDATLTAISSFSSSDQKLYLILGGKLRGRNDSILPYLENFSHVHKIYLIGEAGKFLSQELIGETKILSKKCNGLSDVLMDLKNEKGIVVLSPAFPSYDQYKNFEERGNHFKKLISELF